MKKDPFDSLLVATLILFFVAFILFYFITPLVQSPEPVEEVFYIETHIEESSFYSQISSDVKVIEETQSSDFSSEITREIPSEISSEESQDVSEESIEEVFFEEPHYEIVEQPVVEEVVEVSYEEPVVVQEDELVDIEETDYYWDGPILTATKGVNWGPSGKETYYNLPMDGVIEIMRVYCDNYDEHWIREDGCHMLGDYIMVAADLSIRPRGSLVPTSLGMGIVCDTGGFIYINAYQLDIAVVW